MEHKVNTLLELINTSNATYPLTSENYFLNSKASATYLGVSPSQFYKLVQTKKLECYKPSGKLIYCSLAQLNDYITGGEENTSSIAIEDRIMTQIRKNL